MEIATVNIGENKIKVIKSMDYGLLLTYGELAKGSGASKSNLSLLKSNHRDDFIRGIHFVSVEDVCDEYIESTIDINLFRYRTLFTGSGVKNLLLHVRKKQSRLFLDEYMGLNMDIKK